MGTKRNIKVRFHLGKGKNFMKWRVENLETDQVEFYDPNDRNFVLDMFNCKLYNQQGTANKIHAGANKSVCAWIMCEAVNPFRRIVLNYPKNSTVTYNPSIAPYWREISYTGSTSDVADKKEYEQLTVINKRIIVRYI